MIFRQKHFTYLSRKSRDCNFEKQSLLEGAKFVVIKHEYSNVSNEQHYLGMWENRVFRPIFSKILGKKFMERPDCSNEELKRFYYIRSVYNDKISLFVFRFKTYGMWLDYDCKYFTFKIILKGLFE